MTAQAIQDENAYLTQKNIGSCESTTFWLESPNSIKTQELYETGLMLACRFLKVTPDQLAKTVEADVKRQIVDHVLYLKRKAKKTAGKPKRGEISVNSIPSYMADVKSFLEFHDINLNWKRIAKMYHEQVNNDFRAYTTEEIAKVLSLADVRAKAVVFLIIASGIRVSAIPDLKVKHIVKLGPEFAGIGMIKVYGNSKKYRYLSLLTLEALMHIDRYLADRQQHYETITPESPLIREKFGFTSKRHNKPWYPYGPGWGHRFHYSCSKYCNFTKERPLVECLLLTMRAVTSVPLLTTMGAPYGPETGYLRMSNDR